VAIIILLLRSVWQQAVATLPAGAPEYLVVCSGSFGSLPSYELRKRCLRNLEAISRENE